MNNQKGFGALGIILIIFIILALGFAGWYVWKQNSDDSKSNSQTSQDDQNPSEDQDESANFELLSGDLTFTDDGTWKLAEGGYYEQDAGKCILVLPSEESCLDEIMLIPADEDFTNADQFNVAVRVFDKNSRTVNDILYDINGAPQENTIVDNTEVNGFPASKQIVTMSENEKRLSWAIDVGDKIVLVSSVLFNGDHYGFQTDKDYLGYETQINELVNSIAYK